MRFEEALALAEQAPLEWERFEACAEAEIDALLEALGVLVRGLEAGAGMSEGLAALLFEIEEGLHEEVEAEGPRFERFCACRALLDQLFEAHAEAMG